MAPFSVASLALLMLFGLAPPSSAQFQPQRFTQDLLPSSRSSVIRYNAPPLPPGQGAPSGRRDGGASRGRCEDYSGLSALAPITEGRVWGQTTAAQPTLWFYLPAAVMAETPIRLVVHDTDDNVLYDESLTVDVAAGNLPIALPDTVELPINKPHVWTLSLQCDPERPAAAVFVQGTIERVVAAGIAPFSAESEPSLEQAQAYASQGIWYDALTVTGRLRASEGNGEGQQAWTTLLEQVGLPEAAASPLLPCCELAPME